MVTVYSKADCSQCDMTKKVLKLKGIGYREFRVDEDDAAMAFVKNMGYLAAPVVVIGFENETMGGQHWSGFRPDLLTQLASVN